MSRPLFDICEDLGLQGWAADEAVVAYRNGKIIGMFRYAVGVGRSLCAKGTLVIKSARRQGIAVRLWDLALQKKKPSQVCVFTESREGLKLTKKLSKAYPDISWVIE